MGNSTCSQVSIPASPRTSPVLAGLSYGSVTTVRERLSVPVPAATLACMLRVAVLASGERDQLPGPPRRLRYGLRPRRDRLRPDQQEERPGSCERAERAGVEDVCRAPQGSRRASRSTRPSCASSSARYRPRLQRRLHAHPRTHLLQGARGTRDQRPSLAAPGVPRAPIRSRTPGTGACRTSGVTVHFATEDLDMGPIILQRAVEITADDTLETFEQKIHLIEYALYPEGVEALRRGTLACRRTARDRSTKRRRRSAVGRRAAARDCTT